MAFAIIFAANRFQYASDSSGVLLPRLTLTRLPLAAANKPDNATNVGCSTSGARYTAACRRTGTPPAGARRRYLDR
jgi:hypothetical protein